MSDLTILCKVVDNFGDIGFVYRLAKNLVQLNPQREIRVAVDNLGAFNKIESRVDPALAEQVLEVACADSLQDQEGAGKAGNEGKPKTAAETKSVGKPKNGGRLRIFDATNAAVCAREWTKKPARVILECFQCGRPDWLEEILFPHEDCSLTKNEPPRALIINIDYLTAEDYAEEFHRLKSGTRSALVRKVNFMPGFTAKTGGLILDAAAETASKPKNAPATENGFITKTAGPQVLMFSYPKDFAPIIRAISRWNKAAQVNLAQGAGKESFLAANENCLQASCNPKTAGGLFVRELPFLSQEEWDKNLYAQDILFVRGEDSLSRACLSGKPFVWQAYLQDDNYQLVKVRALLERMRPHFDAEDFAALENFWLLYNGAPGCQDPSAMEAACYEFLSRYDNLRPGFAAFSQSLFELGNFSQKLDEFVGEWAR